jgi:hypothetical protein
MFEFKSKFVGSLLGAALVAAMLAGAAQAATLVDEKFEKRPTSCEGGGCGWSLSVDNQVLGEGSFSSLEDGTLVLEGPVRIEFGEGENAGYIELSGIDGNIDPILGFAVAASTGNLVGGTFAFSFSLPIALSGVVEATSQIGYTLTALSASGATLAPILPSGKTVLALDVDTNGGTSINKGVDVGDAISVAAGGPGTVVRIDDAGPSVFPVTFDYDLMSATIAFSLTRASRVGISGFVQQEEYFPPGEIPEPGTIGLLAAGLGFVGFFAVRRRQQSLA